MLQKIQSSGGTKSNGNGNGSSNFAVRDLRNTIDQHHDSLRSLLQDFMTENIRHNKNAEEFRSEMREDLRNQTGLLSQAVSGITRKLGESSVTGQAQFPTNEFRQITDQHHDSLRKLLEDWTDENIRRVRATDELRAAIQQDIKTQAERLKQIAETRPSATATTTGTMTTNVESEQDREWRDGVQAELRTIIDKLDRMHDRMEEIFQI